MMNSENGLLTCIIHTFVYPSRHFDRNTWSVSGMYEVEKSVPPNDNYYNHRFLHSAYSADASYAPVGMTEGEKFMINNAG